MIKRKYANIADIFIYDDPPQILENINTNFNINSFLPLFKYFFIVKT